MVPQWLLDQGNHQTHESQIVFNLTLCLLSFMEENRAGDTVSTVLTSHREAQRPPSPTACRAATEVCVVSGYSEAALDFIPTF